MKSLIRPLLRLEVYLVFEQQDWKKIIGEKFRALSASSQLTYLIIKSLNIGIYRQTVCMELAHFVWFCIFAKIHCYGLIFRIINSADGRQLSSVCATIYPYE